ncbi:MAG: hypothetical protein RL701_5972 [Pseudomonadota bacterium]
MSSLSSRWLRILFRRALIVASAASISCLSESDVVEPALESEALTAAGFGSVAWEELDGATVSQLKNQLPLLEGRGMALVLHWKAENLDDAERWTLVKAALARGIQVQPWLTLPESQGYFPNATNYAAWIKAERELLSLWRARKLPSTALVVDMELSKDKLARFQELTASGNPFAVAQFLNANKNKQQYAAATSAFRDFVNEVHALGFKVNLTTLLPLLDDYEDRDDYLRQGFNCPIDGIAWDEVSFQIHRTIYAQSYPLTARMVWDYGRLAKKWFPNNAGIGVGLTHAGISSDPDIVYSDGNALRSDVEAALAAGFAPARIGVYSFLGMYNREPASQWFQTARAKQPSQDLGTGLLHASISAIDAFGN